jgi:hypothetical protein
MNTLFAFILLASVHGGAPVQNIQPLATPVTKPVFLEVPKGPNGLTLYNSKGEVVAKCDKRDDSFSGCKMEDGVTLDDLMNAWVHAYQDLQK